MLIFNDNLAFIHIPRTGGWSITRTLHKVNDGVLTGSEVAGGPHLTVRDVDHASFTFVRNPFDRLVSLYNSIWNKVPHLGLAEFLMWCVTAQPQNIYGLSAAHWIRSDDGLVTPTFVGRFERIEEDFAGLGETFGFQIEKLKHLHKRPRPHYREFYDADSRRIVEVHCEWDLHYFGYEY